MHFCGKAAPLFVLATKYGPWVEMAEALWVEGEVVWEDDGWLEDLFWTAWANGCR